MQLAFTFFFFYFPLFIQQIIHNTYVVEKLVRDATIVNHMTMNKLFSDSQYGFRSLRSCALQLLDVMEKWTEWLDESSSFDCINYDCLGF